VSTPEPSTLLLAIAGMAGLPLVRRRRFSSHS
jgi:MYXO-CTERM domain-containing protein